MGDVFAKIPPPAWVASVKYIAHGEWKTYGAIASMVYFLIIGIIIFTIIIIDHHKLKNELKIEGEIDVKKSICASVRIFEHIHSAYQTDSPLSALQQVCVNIEVATVR